MLAGGALLLAIFGNAYYGIVTATDNAAKNRARREYDASVLADETRKSIWLSKVVNRPLEIEMEERLFVRDEELLKEIKETWPYYFGTETEFRGVNKPLRRKNTEGRLIHSHDGYIGQLDALRIIMANRGYLVEGDALYGINIIASYCETRMREAQEIEKQRNFVLAINRRLQARGIDEKMYFHFSGSEIKPFESVRAGPVKWRPVLSSSAMILSQYLYGNKKTR